MGAPKLAPSTHSAIQGSGTHVLSVLPHDLPPKKGDRSNGFHGPKFLLPISVSFRIASGSKWKLPTPKRMPIKTNRR